MADVDIRELTDGDAEAAGRLSWEAFGVPADTGGARPSPRSPGRHPWGAFIDGRLAARVVDREFDSWFGGVAVPTSGIAGVAAVAEHRGAGLLGPLFAAALTGARERGALISGLFPTQPGIYRRSGYELITSLDTVRVPTVDLRAVRAPAGVTVRRAGPGDVDAVERLYERWACVQNGALTRRGGSSPDRSDEFTSPSTAVTVAERDGAAVGYAVWERGPHVGEQAVVRVHDLISADAGGTAALLRLLGSFASAVPTAAITTSGADVARLLLPSTTWTVVETHPYLLKIIDVAGFLSVLPYPAFTASVPFTQTGDVVTGQDGGYRLEVADGRGSCAVAPPSGPVFTAHGLVLVVTGAQSCANARMAGQLTGPETYDATLDALFGGRQQHIRDYY